MVLSFYFMNLISVNFLFFVQEKCREFNFLKMSNINIVICTNLWGGSNTLEEAAIYLNMFMFLSCSHTSRLMHYKKIQIISNTKLNLACCILKLLYDNVSIEAIV